MHRVTLWFVITLSEILCKLNQFSENFHNIKYMRLEAAPNMQLFPVKPSGCSMAEKLTLVHFQSHALQVA